MSEPKLYIGLMSGTSMDAVDGVLLSLEDGSNRYEVVDHTSQPISAQLRNDIHLLSYPGRDDIHRLGTTDRALGKLFAGTALDLLGKAKLSAGDISAIGSHGQTIRHYPPSIATGLPYSLQIGDPSTIAADTGIATVADFRRKDIALNGEAAPLVPAFHHAVFQSSKLNRAVVNIGGIANITWLPRAARGVDVQGFDCGPGNCLMDEWIRRHLSVEFDSEGQWASSGKVIEELLNKLLDEPYFTVRPPKSTGKELFNQRWLQDMMGDHLSSEPSHDIQATLCEFTALSIVKGLDQISGGREIDEIYICGGGAFNTHLMSRLRATSACKTVDSTDRAGIHPLHVEAAAFAWLAHQTLTRTPGSLAGVTGASRPAVLGGIYFP